MPRPGLPPHVEWTSSRREFFLRAGLGIAGKPGEEIDQGSGRGGILGAACQPDGEDSHCLQLARQRPDDVHAERRYEHGNLCNGEIDRAGR